MTDLLGNPTRKFSAVEVKITAEIKAETAHAWLISDGEREVWLPKSRVRREDIQIKPQGSERHQTAVFFVPKWLAKEKELI
jgi:secreted trypsin-like serine protease